MDLPKAFCMLASPSNKCIFLAGSAGGVVTFDSLRQAFDVTAIV